MIQTTGYSMKSLRECLCQPFCNTMSLLFGNNLENRELVGTNFMFAPSFPVRNRRKDNNAIGSHYLLNHFYIPGTVLML